MSTALIIGPKEKAELARLRELAAANPVHMPTLIERIKTPEGKAAHMRAMTEQTIDIPTDFMVTFSIELGHPLGTCRHMSMSVGKKGRLPNQHALEMVMDELGFYGELDDCHVWLEDLKGHNQAINVLQPITAPAGTA